MEELAKILPSLVIKVLALFILSLELLHLRGRVAQSEARQEEISHESFEQELKDLFKSGFEHLLEALETFNF